MYKISFHKRVGKFQVSLDKIHLGYFTSYSDAVVKRNTYLFEKNGPAGLLIEWMLRKHKCRSKTAREELKQRKYSRVYKR